MAHLWVLLFDVFVLGGLCFVGAVVFLLRYRAQRTGRRSPLARHLLRSPGESLRAQIEDAQWDIAMYLALGMLPLPLVLGTYFTIWIAGAYAPPVSTAAILALFGFVAQGWLATKLWKALSRLRRLRLGHEAQLAIGQELSELGRSGFRIFHDFPANDGTSNIDHVVVGSSGVFLVETKGRSRPGRKGKTEAPWEVKYDGKALQFPGWTETEPLVQAQRNAQWLEKWLSSAVGQSMSVQPVVALPGWFVRGVEGEGIPVLAAGQIQGYFSARPKQPLMSPELIRQIVVQLDQKSRDVQPRTVPEIGVRALKA
jgi:hypothetical protein